MPILKLEIYQPQAHYRIPFSYVRRHTYPIPPYSTIIGFLCNICGVDDQREKIYNIIRELKISISGRFKQKITENIWFRNLDKDAHLNSYRSLKNREQNGQIGHIGGQSPIKIDVLEDMELVIYLYHKDQNSLSEIDTHISTANKRLQPLHIGRSEDWIVIRNNEMLPEDKFEFKRQDGNYHYFSWIPEKISPLKGNDNLDWNNFDGIIYTITTHSHIENYEQNINITGRRIYKSIKVKLNDGKIINTACLFDTTSNIPVFLGDL